MSAVAIKEIEPKCTPEQAGVLAKFRSAIDDAKVTDNELCRYLRVNDWNDTKALEQYKAMLQWRKDRKVDEVLAQPFAKAELINRIVPYAYHKTDKDGRAVYWERTGAIASAALGPHVTLAEFEDSHIWGMEKMAKLAQEQSEKLGRRVDDFTTILDLQGLSMSHLNAVSYLRACAQIDQKYYPERLARVFIVNAPWIMPMAYNTVKPVIGEAVADKVKVLADPSELKDYIDLENLPEEYGGTCKCGEGGCCPISNCDDLVNAKVQTEAEKHAHLGLIKYNVPAGKSYQQTVTCGEKGGAFMWFFESMGQYDIEFSVKVAGGETVFAPRRICTGKGMYQSKRACTLIFTWNNDFSYFNSKDLEYHVSVNEDVGSVDMGSVSSGQSGAEVTATATAAAAAAATAKS